MSDTRRPTMEELDKLPEFQDDEEDFEDDLPEDDEYDEEEKTDTVPSEQDHVLSLEEIIGLDDLDEEEVYVPDWKGKVVLRGLSKREFDHMRRQANRRDARGKRNDILEKEMIIAGLVKPAINSATYEMLQEKAAGAFVLILNEIYRKSGLEREAEKTRERRFPPK